MDNMTDALGESAGCFPASDDEEEELRARIVELETQQAQVRKLLRQLPGFMPGLMLAARDSFKMDPATKAVADELLTLLGVEERLT